MAKIKHNPGEHFVEMLKWFAFPLITNTLKLYSICFSQTHFSAITLTTVHYVKDSPPLLPNFYHEVKKMSLLLSDLHNPKATQTKFWNNIRTLLNWRSTKMYIVIRLPSIFCAHFTFRNIKQVFWLCTSIQCFIKSKFSFK